MNYLTFKRFFKIVIPMSFLSALLLIITIAFSEGVAGLVAGSVQAGLILFIALFLYFLPQVKLIRKNSKKAKSENSGTEKNKIFKMPFKIFQSINIQGS